MLSQDKKIFEEGNVRRRMISYGSIFTELHIIVFGTGLRQEAVLAPNVTVTGAGGRDKASAFFSGTREALTAGRQMNADIISAQDPFFIGAAGVWVAKRLNIPLQIQLHTDCFSFAFAFASVRNAIETFLAFFIIQQSSCIRVVSERVARSVKRFTKEAVSVLPILSPISTDETPSGRPEAFHGNYTVLSVSRLTKEKRVHLLIEAIARVPDVDLVIVGEGPMRKMLARRAKKLRVEDRVRFVGWQDDLAPYYAHADLFVAVSRYEGYGLSMVEAAQHGLPIIATDVGIVGEVFRPQDDVLVVQPNRKSIADALFKIVRDRDLAETLSAHAKERAMAHIIGNDVYLARYKESMHTCTI